MFSTNWFSVIIL